MATQYAPPVATPAKRYEDDAYGWAIEQAALLRARTPVGLDWENVAEEIDSVGRSERKELESRFEVLIEHLIKLAVCDDGGPRAGWWETVEEQRDRAEKILAESPSLRPRRSDLFEGVWRYGLRDARRGLRREAERERVPARPFLTVEQAMTIDTDAELAALLP